MTLHRLVSLILVNVLTTVVLLLLGCSILGILAIPYVFIGLSFTEQAVLIEGRGSIAAIRRSWQLVEGHRWRIFVCGAAVSAIIRLVISGPIYLFHWLTGADSGNPLSHEGGFGGADTTTQFVWLAGQGIEVFETTFLSSLFLILLTVLYFDLRAREAPYQMPSRPSPTAPPSE